jgi:superfamily II DNA or RNA helicase
LLQELFERVRKVCSPQTWSRGVELARDECVGARGGGDTVEDELRLQVQIPGRSIGALVSLYPDDEEWDCDCRSAAEVCEHVAAAVIAARRAAADGKPVGAAAEGAGRIRYLLTRTAGGGLALEREVVTGASALRLETTLEAISSGRVGGPRFTASQSDMAVEVALGGRRRGPLDEVTLRRAIEPLSRCDEVWLDGEPVRVSAEPLRPLVVVDDAPRGFRVRLADAPGIRERFSLGFAVCDDELRPLGASRLTGRELHDLKPGRVYPYDEAARIVTEILPALSDRLEVDIQTDKLPRTTRSERPRIRVETEQRGDRLSVLATIVYGDPPLARVDSGRLVHLSGPVPVRNQEAEQREASRVMQELGLTPGRRLEASGSDAIALSQRIASWKGPVAGEAHRHFHATAALVPSLAIEGTRLDVGFHVPSDGDAPAREVAAEAVLGAWRRGESLVPILGGGMAPLPADWLERFGPRVADLLAARSERGEISSCALPDLARLCDELDQPPPPQLEALRPLLEDFEGLPVAPLPDDLTAELRHYQDHGIDWLSFLGDAGLGALLADDMGLGKTLQALCAMQGRTLVVAPTSVLSNWRDEAARFRPGLRTQIYHGGGRQLDPRADLTLTSYAILRLDAPQLQAVDWDCVVLDEAQMIKNPESQSAQAAYALSARQRIALTGTPVENRLEELWSQLHFLNRGLLGGRSDFRDRYARPIAAGDGEAAARLRERIKPFVLRRLKSEVAAELPPRSDVVLRFDLSDEERSLYDAVRAAGLDEAVRALRTGGSLMPALEVLLRLRQAACHSSLVPGGPEDASSSKLELLIMRLEEARDDGHRALVFSQWTKLLDRIEPELEAAGIGFERLDGSTRDRGGVVGRFQSGSAPVMLVSLRAGGVGLNLTAADHVFLMDPWWNPAVEDQAADRAHRIGQTRPVVVHRLIAQDTVEERILDLHASKRALAQAALGDATSEGSASGLTRDDLLALLD